MNKDFIVSLLRKDIDELQTLTEGFEYLTVFPEPIIRLAEQKAENISSLLQKLSRDFTEKLKVFEQEEAEVLVTLADVEVQKDDEIDNLETQSDVLTEEIIEVEEEEPVQVAEETPEISVEPIEVKTVIVSSDIDLESAKREEFQEEVEVEELSEKNDNTISYPIHKEVKTHQPRPKETVTEQPEPGKPIPAPAGISLNDKLQEQGTHSLGDNLAKQKIGDIRQAMNIGDRFRFQRELFGGNGEVMNKTISYLNQLAKYEEAESFLKSKFGWDDDNPHAEEFLQLIRKRY